VADTERALEPNPVPRVTAIDSEPGSTTSPFGPVSPSSTGE
jgi:hypothetical protein